MHVPPGTNGHGTNKANIFFTGAYLSEQQQHHLSMMCQDSGPSESKAQIEDRKSKKRKADDLWVSNPKKVKPLLTEILNSDSGSDNSEYVNEDDNTMNSNSTNDDIEGRESSASQNEFASDLELSGIDATDTLGGQENRPSSDMDNSIDGESDDIRFVPYQILISFAYLYTLVTQKVAFPERSLKENSHKSETQYEPHTIL